MKKRSIEATILLVATILAIFTPAITLAPSTDSIAAAMPKKKDIFKGSFSPRDITSHPNKAFDASFSISPTMDTPNTTIRFIIPPGLVKLVKGEKVWTGDVSKGETVTLDLSFATEGEVEAYIRANVKAQISGKNYHSSYYLHITTPKTKFNPKKGGSTAPVNPNIDIPTTPDPGEPRPLMNSESPETIETKGKSVHESPESPGTIRIKGRFVYVNEDGGYSAARYMLVWLRDDDYGADEWVKYQWTDSNGNYDITADNDDGFLQDGRDPYIQLWAEGAWDWITTTSGGSQYYWNNPKCGNDVNDGFFYDYGTRVPTSGNEAFQAGDAVYEEAQWIYNLVTWARPTKVTIRWPREDWPHCHGDYIDLPDKATASWDHVTVHHEYAHAVMWTLYGNSWPEGFEGGTHWVYMEDVLPDAWVEGWAEFMQCAVDNDPNNLRSGGANIETNDWYNWQDTGDMDGAYIEGEVASILWDIFDPTSTGDKDYLSWGYNQIFIVLRYGDAGADDNPNSAYDFWSDWISRWSDLHTSKGPLSTIYWHYGIDRDYYAPHYGSISINCIGFKCAIYTTSRSVTLTLSASDWGSGVAYMRFSNVYPYVWSSLYTYSTSKSWTLSTGDGTKYVYVQYRDKKGYYSSVYYDTIILDTTDPTGSISINSGATYTTSTSVTLYLTYYDATSGVDKVRYANYGEYWTSWMTPSSTKAWTLPSGDGTKYVYYQVKDNVGWTSDVYQDTIILDTTDPTGSININAGASYTTSTSVTLYLTYSDATSGVDKVRYGNWGEPWTAWESPSATRAWTLSSGDGTKRVYYQIRDNAGWYSTQYYDEIVLDTTSPTGSIVINSGNPTYTTSTSVTLYLTYYDATSGVDMVRYENSGGSWTAWEPPSATRAWTLPSGDGTKRVYYQIRDNAGLLSIQYYDEIILDTAAPTTTISHSPGSSIVKLSATDTTSGVKATYYRIDGGAWNTYTGPITLTGTGSHTIDYYSEDNAGNTETTKSQTYHYLIVNTDPTRLDAPTGEGWYDAGENATVSVSSVSGYTFEYWYLDGDVGTPHSFDMTTEVTMDGPHTATAKFSIIMCEVTFYTDPVGEGFNITFQGETYSNDQSGNFTYGTSGSANANGSKGWVFDHWESTTNVTVSEPDDNPTDITIRCGGNLTAIFKPLSNVKITDFYVRPSHFSPNGDGRKDTTIIRAKFTGKPDEQPIQTTSVEWTLKAKTTITVTMRTWIGTGGTLYVRWDGTDDSGKILPDGEYYILLQGRDSDGNLTEIESRLVVIDTVGPKIKDVSDSPDPFNPTAGETTTINYTLSEKCYVMIKIYDPAGRLIQLLRAIQPAGENSMTWDGKVQGLIVPDGTYTYEIHATDKAGNKLSAPATGTVTVKT